MLVMTEGFAKMAIDRLADLQHPYGDARPVYAWVQALVFEARRLPLAQRDALRLQALAHRRPGDDAITPALRTAAGNALATLQARLGELPKGGARSLETAAKRAVFGVFDEERVSADNFRIMLWTPEHRLWMTVIEDYRWSRDLTAWCVLAAVLASQVPEPVSAVFLGGCARADRSGA